MARQNESDSESSKTRLAKNLRLAREAAGLTQAELGERAGRSRQTVVSWESEEPDAPKPDEAMLDTLAGIFGIEKAELRYGDVVRRGPSRLDAPSRVREDASELYFASTTVGQQGRRWVEEFLSGLADRGASSSFIGAARRFLLNADNYEFDDGRAPGQQNQLSDEQKLRHMKGLATTLESLLGDLQKKGKTK